MLAIISRSHIDVKKLGARCELRTSIPRFPITVRYPPHHRCCHIGSRLNARSPGWWRGSLDFPQNFNCAVVIYLPSHVDAIIFFWCFSRELGFVSSVAVTTGNRRRHSTSLTRSRCCNYFLNCPASSISLAEPDRGASLGILRRNSPDLFQRFHENNRLGRKITSPDEPLHVIRLFVRAADNAAVSAAPLDR